MPKKKVPPTPDGSVLLVLYHPFGLPSTEARVGSIMQFGNAPNKEVIHRVKQILRWLAHLGLRVNQIFGKRTELAVIVDVQESDEASIEAAIGMHLWQKFLPKCPQNWLNQTSHIYRCVSTSIEHLERTLGFTEYLGIDLGSLEPRQLRGEGTFAHPCPPPCLPDDDRWPPRQSGLTLYIRPKVLSGTRLAPSEEVDDFLNSIALAQSSSKVEPSHETVERVKNESNSEDQRALLNIEGIVVKSEESELPIDPHFSGDTTDPPPPEPVDPLSGFDEETRSKMSAILQGIGVTNLAELPSDFFTKLKESVVSRIEKPDAGPEADNPAEQSSNTRSPATAKKRKDSAHKDRTLKRVKAEESDW